MNRSALEAGLCAVVVGASMLIPSTATAQPAATANGSELAGMTVFLDPGHQGSSVGHDLAQQVDDGRGGTKDCQTSGMTALGGVPEHTINWNVSQLVKSSLETLGARVVQSRTDDIGWGGCVDERARAASESKADLAVSIHADSTAVGGDPAHHGFHMIVPTLPIPDAQADAAQSGPGLQASKMMRDAYVEDGFTSANYAGVVDGLQTRGDVAGPALSRVPLVFVEMGNGSHPDDSAVLESPEGQLKHAIAITTGIVTYLLTGAPSAPDVQAAAPAAEPDEMEAPTTNGETLPVPSGASGLLSRVFTMLAPLFEVDGLGGLEGLVNDENLGLLSDLASTLLSFLLDSMDSMGN